MKKSLIDSIAKQNTVTAKVFTCFFFDWENSSTVSWEIYPDRYKEYGKRRGRIYPKFRKKISTNVPIIYSIFKKLKDEKYLDEEPMRKGYSNKYVGTRPYFRANEKAFLEYFKEKYGWKPSKQALFIIKALLEYERDYFKGSYNENINIFENFIEFLKPLMKHYFESRPIGTRFVSNEIKKVIKDSGYNFEKCRSVLDGITHLVNTEGTYISYFFAELVNTMPEAYTNIKLGLFKASFIDMLENKNKKIPVTKEILNKIKSM